MPLHGLGSSGLQLAMFNFTDPYMKTVLQLACLFVCFLLINGVGLQNGTKYTQTNYKSIQKKGVADLLKFQPSILGKY